MYDENSEIVFRKTTSEIDQDELFKVLKKYHKLLGLE